MNADTPIGRTGALWSSRCGTSPSWWTARPCRSTPPPPPYRRDGARRDNAAQPGHAVGPAASVPTDGETISIKRITGTTEMKQVSIPYTTTKLNDSSQYVGTTSVITQGQDGDRAGDLRGADHQRREAVPKQISQTVIKQPVNEVDKVGTKALPTSASQLNWAALANASRAATRSRGHRQRLYYGMYQFSICTWDSLGGSGLPSNARAATRRRGREAVHRGRLRDSGRCAVTTCSAERALVTSRIGGMRQPAQRNDAGEVTRSGGTERRRSRPARPRRGAAARGTAGRAADQAARPELRHRPEHHPAHRRGGCG